MKSVSKTAASGVGGAAEIWADDDNCGAVAAAAAAPPPRP